MKTSLLLHVRAVVQTQELEGHRVLEQGFFFPKRWEEEGTSHHSCFMLRQSLPCLSWKYKSRTRWPCLGNQFPAQVILQQRVLELSGAAGLRHAEQKTFSPGAAPQNRLLQGHSPKGLLQLQVRWRMEAWWLCLCGCFHCHIPHGCSWYLTQGSCRATHARHQPERQNC